MDTNERLEKMGNDIQVIIENDTKKVEEIKTIKNDLGEIRKLTDEIGPLKDMFNDFAKRLEDNRFGADGVDKILAVIPKENKKDIYLSEMLSKTKMVEKMPIFKDPVKATACAAWLQKALFIDMYPGKAAQYKEELDKMIQVIGGAHVTKEALEQGVDAEGGNLVPTILEGQILDLIEDYGVVRPLATVVPMTTWKHQFPHLGTNFSVYLVDEEGTISDSAGADPFGQKTLEAKKFCGLVTVSIELILNNAVGFMVWLNRHLSEKIARLEDTQALEGDGTGVNFTGLSDDTDVNEIAAAGADGDEPSYALFSKMKWKAREKSTRQRAVYVVAPEIAGKVERLVDDNSRPIFTQPFPLGMNPQVQGPVVDGYILSYPLHAHSGLSITRTKGTGADLSYNYFGPMENIVFGDRAGISFGVSEHVNWATGQLSIRVIKMTGIMVAKPAAFTRGIDTITG